MFLFFVLLGFLVALCTYYLSGKYNENYWKKRGVVFCQKNKVFGPIWGFLRSDKALFQIFNDDLYKKYPNEPAIGIGSLLCPALYVRDPRNIEHVLQSDFSSFSHRGTEIYEKDVLADNVLFMNGSRWKLMRQGMTPLFTTTKLKDMFYIIDKSAKDFVDYLKRDPTKLKGDAYDTVRTFCSAAIGAAVFGIQTKSVFDSPFFKMAIAAFAPTTLRNIKFFLQRGLMPKIIKLLRIEFFPEFRDFFISAIKQVIRKREQEGIKRHDFADMCVTLQKNGTLRDPDTGFELEPTDELLAAQGFFFFTAGVDPTATAIFTALVELGRNPGILQKLHDEIDVVWEKYSGEISYETVTEFEYLDKALNEAMRMYPPIGFSTRMCVEDTVLPVGNIKVSKGTLIFIPIFEVHHDPNFFSNPEVFDPERLSLVNKNDDLIFRPFGIGKRKCIGIRYARMQAKTGMIHLLREFTPKTTVLPGGIKYLKHQIQVRPTNLKLEFLPRKKVC